MPIQKIQRIFGDCTQYELRLIHMETTEDEIKNLARKYGAFLVNPESFTDISGKIIETDKKRFFKYPSNTDQINYDSNENFYFCDYFISVIVSNGREYVIFYGKEMVLKIISFFNDIDNLVENPQQVLNLRNKTLVECRRYINLLYMLKLGYFIKITLINNDVNDEQTSTLNEKYFNRLYPFVNTTSHNKNTLQNVELCESSANLDSFFSMNFSSRNQSIISDEPTRNREFIDNEKQKIYSKVVNQHQREPDKISIKKKVLFDSKTDEEKDEIRKKKRESNAKWKLKKLEKEEEIKKHMTEEEYEARDRDRKNKNNTYRKTLFDSKTDEEKDEIRKKKRESDAKWKLKKLEKEEEIKKHMTEEEYEARDRDRKNKNNTYRKTLFNSKTDEEKEELRKNWRIYSARYRAKIKEKKIKNFQEKSDLAEK